MKSWKFKAGIVGVFALGVVVGVVGTGVVLRYRYGNGLNRPEQAVDRIVDKLSHELRLSDDQIQVIRPIVTDSFTKMRALRSRLTPEVEALIEQTSARIRPYLTPEQQKQLQVHDNEVLNRWKQFAGPGAPPLPPLRGMPPGPPPGPAPK